MAEDVPEILHLERGEIVSEPQISPQRLRTLYVMKILLRYSDEDQTLS